MRAVAFVEPHVVVALFPIVIVIGVKDSVQVGGGPVTVHAGNWYVPERTPFVHVLCCEIHCDPNGTLDD